MRIDRLEIKNFKKFSDYTLDLHPQFTLLIGDNGTGKTSILDALAIAAGVWLVNSPDTTLNNSRRNILRTEIRLEAISIDSIIQFIERTPTQIKAIGTINDQPIQWLRQIKENSSRTSNTESKEALNIISKLFKQVAASAQIWLPVMAYYGAGRSWLPFNQRDPKAIIKTSPSRRWEAFYDCFEERLSISRLNTWFQKEAIAAVNRQGKMRPSYEVVKLAILRCIPNAENIWYDPERSQIVISIQNNPQPFSNLSAGQKMMVALVADLAIKIVTQNAAFLPKEIDPDNQALPQILQQTTGLVLIDEIDVHLHPKWQRQVINDLKTTFPALQFVCTTHSPIITSEVEAKSIRFLEYEAENGGIISTIPSESYGLDANRVLDELMGVSERNKEVTQNLHKMFQLIDDEDFDMARQAMIPLISKIGDRDPEITRAQTLIKFLEG